MWWWGGGGGGRVRGEQGELNVFLLSCQKARIRLTMDCSFTFTCCRSSSTIYLPPSPTHTAFQLGPHTRPSNSAFLHGPSAHSACQTIRRLQYNINAKKSTRFLRESLFTISRVLFWHSSSWIRDRGQEYSLSDLPFYYIINAINSTRFHRESLKTTTRVLFWYSSA